MKTFEVNFDGLVGPTHNFAGLSYGNIAATAHAHEVSSPKQAALQGLKKMKTLRDLGLQQGVLLPHERPHISSLKRLGFSGSDADFVANALKASPMLYKQVCSGSAMWVANAATVSPFTDTLDAKTHFTPANLSSMFHRSIESEVTTRMLQRIFNASDYCHHPALPHGTHYADEGAANHTRFCGDYGEAGVELFVYGASSEDKHAPAPKKFPARQTKESCEALVRLHQLSSDNTVIAQQHPNAIDSGVFHNDVISVGNKNIFFLHERAFINNARVIDELQSRAAFDLNIIEVKENEVSLQDAVNTYLFNTQLISPSNSASTGTHIVAPSECQANPAVYEYLTRLASDNSAIDAIHYFDLKQSMNNGGGPACLRLRVVMSEKQIAQLDTNVMLTDNLYDALCAWVEKHYRDALSPSDLADPSLLRESREALDELTQITGVGDIYDFQREG